MKEVKEKLEIIIVALGDVDDFNNEDETEEDKQTVLFDEIGGADEETNPEGKVPENKLSLQLQKFGYDAGDADLLLEMLPEGSLEEQNENVLPEEESEHELYTSKSKRSGKYMKPRKVKFNDELCRTRQPRLCEIHKNNFDKLSLSNKPLIIGNEEPISSKDSVNGGENENSDRKANTNDEIIPRRIPVQMRSVNMFNSVLPSASSLLKHAPILKGKNATANIPNGGRNQVKPVWIKNKSIRKIDANKTEAESININSVSSIVINDYQVTSIKK